MIDMKKVKTQIREGELLLEFEERDFSIDTQLTFSCGEIIIPGLNYACHNSD
jgi:hypothetical protein